MMRSLYSGVAGLKTHQTKMDVIGNNIANVNTTSFKSQSITFSDLMYQTTQTASGATETKGGVNARQIGLGAKSGAINTAITAQGATQTTNNPFDIMITGESFFVVSDGSKRLYTRDGSFYVDGAGNLAMQSNGYLVQGWAAQEDRETGEISINKNGELTSLQLMSAANYTYAPASTTSALYSGNIDKADGNVTSVDGKTITLEFYDNKGYLYTGKFTLKNTLPEENHMYALTLTDIIDSNGKSINENEKQYDLLSQITFGDVDSDKRTSSPITTQPTYHVTAGSSSATVSITKDDGDVKFEKVPASGKLINLMSPSESKNASLANLLKDAYGLTDDVVKATYPGYATADYSIDASGRLIISSAVKDVPALSNTAEYDSYNYKYDNANNTRFLVDSATQKAYRVPSAVGTDASELSAHMLKDVFNIDQTFGSNHNYTYDSDGTLKVFKNIGFAAGTAKLSTLGSNEDAIKAQLQQFATGVNSTTGALTNSVVADIEASGFGFDSLEYTLTSSGELTIKHIVTGTEDASYSTKAADGITQDDIDRINTELSTLNWGTAAASEITYADLSTAATTADPEVAASINKILNQVAALHSGSALDGNSSALDDLKITLTSLSGDNGLAVGYTKSTETKEAFPDPTSSSRKYGNQPVKTASSINDGPYRSSVPTQVFSHNYPSTEDKSFKYETGFVVEGNTIEFDSTTLTANSDLANFLKTVYSGSADEINGFISSGMQAGVTYTLNFESSGFVSISHKEDAAPIESVYQYEKDDNDNTFTYKTSQAYLDIPKSGNISDLLEKTGKYPGVLSKVYGISDKNAAAYGLDGTYTIDNTTGSTTYGQITLKTGNHTIQLKFNADDGMIESADNDGLTKKANITFGQGYPGLEAFGFQAAPNNASEQERAFTISVDFSNLTNYNTNGSSTIKATKGDISSLNTGRAVGEMNGISVSTNGSIFATYSNGQTKLLGQIATAEFANASGLSKEGDNLYTSTLNSGEATIQDITTDGGYMNTGVLEMSNVDLSSQFTEMITTQRGFQANSRIITVSDTLLEELTNLKR